MKRTDGDIRVVLITAPEAEVARRLARVLLEARAVACVSIIPGVESHYWWDGRLEQSGEVMLVAKALAGTLPTVEMLVQQHHPYECPEVLALPVTEGAEKYLAWVGGVITGR